MPSIDANTGRLFAANELGEDIKQGIYDRVVTPIGERRHRPAYGTLLARFGPEDDRIPASIAASLSGDQRVHTVDFEVNRGRKALQVFVNRQFRVTAG